MILSSKASLNLKTFSVKNSPHFKLNVEPFRSVSPVKYNTVGFIKFAFCEAPYYTIIVV